MHAYMKSISDNSQNKVIENKILTSSLWKTSFFFFLSFVLAIQKLLLLHPLLLLNVFINFLSSIIYFNPRKREKKKELNVKEKRITRHIDKYVNVNICYCMNEFTT